MKIVAKILALVLGFLVLVVLAFYVFVAHPNDARLSLDDAPLAPPEQRLERVADLLSGATTDSEYSAAERVSAHRRLRELMPDAISTSRRFVSREQVYAVVGTYPWRLDGRDGWLIPPGGSLKVRWDESGEVLRFGAVAPEGASLIVSGAAVGKYELPAFRPGPSYDGFWNRQILSFIRVDRRQDLAYWQEAELPLVAESMGELLFRCEAASGAGCVVAEPEILRRQPKQEAPRSPNVVMIMIDTLRGDGPFGGHAPRMAELAERSIVFDRALAAGNMTSPSTNAVLSCRRPSELGSVAFSYGASGDIREDHYAKGQPSVAALLAARGYETGMIGNVSVLSEIYGVGIHHGFRRQIAVERDGYDTVEATREALGWLRANGDRPFFLYVHYHAPHAPYRAPWSDLVETWPGISALKSYPDLLRWLYQGEVHYTDRYVGRLFDGLKEMGLLDDTLIILSSDHGDQHKILDFRRNETGPDFSGAYFDHGATLHNDEINVPLFIKPPRSASGRHESTFVQTLDAGPTILEAVGLDVPASCAGRSLLPFVDGRGADGELLHRVLASEGFRARAILFDQRYKFIRTYEPTDKLVYRSNSFVGQRQLYMAERQLFDLVDDPGEKNDLSRTRSDLMERAELLYAGIYSLKQAYELVVEAPAGQPLVVTLPPGSKFSVESTVDYDDRLTIVRDSPMIQARDIKRLVIALDDWRGEPRVEIGGQEMRILRTASRLPLDGSVSTLPVERAGAGHLLAPSLMPSAYVRRVERDGQGGRRIVSGNPKFDKILREWGYLNDR